MRLVICLICAIVGGLLGFSGMFRHGPGGLLLGLAFGLVLAELQTVRKRLRRLEDLASRADPQETREEGTEVRFEPVPEGRATEAERPPVHVITSYSIHYTKLYDAASSAGSA